MRRKGVARLDMTAESAIKDFVTSVRQRAREACETDAPEAVHQLRVAIRRTRAGLRLADAEGAVTLRDELRMPFKQAGAVRDLDVTIGLIEEASVGLDSNLQVGAEAIMARLRRQRGLARSALRRSLRSKRFAEVVDRVGDADIAVAAAQKRTPAGQVRLLKRRRQDLRAAARTALDSRGEADLHALRLRVKRLRYVIEALDPDSAKAKAYLRSLRRLQDLLGRHHDFAVARDTAGETAAELDSPKATEAAGAMAVHFDSAIRELLVPLPDVYGGVSGKKRWRQARKALTARKTRAAA